MFDTNDDFEVKGYIDKNTILQYVSEEDIFELVFNFKPKEFDYTISPFRDDDNSGCWFAYNEQGKLKFTDFGSQIYINHRQMISIDCFDAIQVFFKLPNYYQTLNFIKNTLIRNKNLQKRELLITTKTLKKEVSILIEVRNFESRDAKYWKSYQISRQNLIEDNVFAVKRFKIINSKFGDFSSNTYDLCYAHTEFDNSKKKLHRPHQKGKNRFLTNCGSNDIYGINKLIDFGDLLVISKSYKDYRVLKNQGLNVIAFQNEGMIPKNEVLLPICKRFNNIIIFFDNDVAGIEAGNKVSTYINSYFPGKSKSICLDTTLVDFGITDPSDLISKQGKEALTDFLTNNKLL